MLIAWNLLQKKQSKQQSIGCYSYLESNPHPPASLDKQKHQFNWNRDSLLMSFVVRVIIACPCLATIICRGEFSFLLQAIHTIAVWDCHNQICLVSLIFVFQWSAELHEVFYVIVESMCKQRRGRESKQTRQLAHVQFSSWATRSKPHDMECYPICLICERWIMIYHLLT